MRYYYQDETSPRLGPYTKEELRQLHLSGVVRAETLVTPEGTETAIPFRELWTQWQSPPPEAAEAARGFARRTSEDLRALAPHLLLPFKEIRYFDWLKSRRLIAIAAVGLVPLFVHSTSTDVLTSFWAIALYCSVLWALFFYYVFPTPEVRISTAALCFFASGVLSISVLLLAYQLPPLSWLIPVVQSRDLLSRLFGFTVAVGLPEELCKALPLLVLLKKSDPLPPQVMLFYGLMAGLGFGIYEGVSYQMDRNFRFASTGAEYYLLNVIRLTALPFLHAMWTGIAGYFIGFAGMYPRRQLGLLIIGLGLPAVLHGFYNTFSGTIIGLGFALLTVLALNVYLARSVEFEEMLIEQNLSDLGNE